MLTDNTITLRAPEPADIDEMYIWENDPSIWTKGSSRMPMSRQLLYDFVNSYNPDPNVTGQMRLIIESCATGMAVGCLDLYDYDSLNRRSGVGIVIDPAHQGHGYASRALKLTIDYCRTFLGLHQLWAIVNRENEVSQHLFRSCGFRSCGSLRSWVRVGNRYTDALMFQALL